MSLDLSGLKNVIVTAAEVLAGFAVLAGIGLWLLHSMRLAANASNPQNRADAVDSLGRVLIGMIIMFLALTIAGLVLWLVQNAGVGTSGSGTGGA